MRTVRLLEHGKCLPFTFFRSIVWDSRSSVAIPLMWNNLYTLIRAPLLLGPQAARLHTSTAGASPLLALRARVQASRLRSQ